jgi:hypothetical protein
MGLGQSYRLEGSLGCSALTVRLADARRSGVTEYLLKDPR